LFHTDHYSFIDNSIAISNLAGTKHTKYDQGWFLGVPLPSPHSEFKSGPYVAPKRRVKWFHCTVLHCWW